MITIKNEKGIFQLRCAAVIRKDEKILLLNEPHVTYWFLPGGRLEMNESTKDAIEREISEEMGTKAKVNDLIWIIENFFVLRNSPFHEICFYYEASLFDNHPLNTKDEYIYETKENEKMRKFHFRWFSFEETKDLDIRPSCIKNLFSSKSDKLVHLIFKD